MLLCLNKNLRSFIRNNQIGLLLNSLSLAKFSNFARDEVEETEAMHRIVEVYEASRSRNLGIWAEMEFGSRPQIGKVAYNDERGDQERKMYQGNWKCSKCGAEIKELPFEPDPARMGQLQCRDCYRKDRPPR